MKMVVNTRGAYLSKEGECFQVKVNGASQDIPAKKVEQILITNSVAFTSDAIEMAVENNIDILFINALGQPIGRVWHSKMGSICTIRRNQLCLQTHPLGIQLVKEWLTQKLDNQMKLLSKLAMNRRDSRRETIKNTVNQIENVKIKINETCSSNVEIDLVRDTLQGYEGTAGRLYFGLLSELLPPNFQFQGRSKNPAKDYFNCLLNYGYGILYGNIERSCIIAGLDPYIGIMHTDNYNRKAFTFDLIEQYRVYIDEIVMRIFSQKKVKSIYFDEIEGGYYLNKEGKQLLIGEYNQEMEKKIRYKGRNIELQNIIQYDCHIIANRILKEV